MFPFIHIREEIKSARAHVQIAVDTGRDVLLFFNGRTAPRIPRHPSCSGATFRVKVRGVVLFVKGEVSRRRRRAPRQHNRQSVGEEDSSHFI